MSTQGNYLAGVMAKNTIETARQSLWLIQHSMRKEETDPTYRMYLSEYVRDAIQEELDKLVSEVIKTKELVRTRTTKGESE